MSLLFSIIIPTLNEERFLPTLFASLAKQTTTSFEIIVVDGGSEDATVKLVRKWQRRWRKQGIRLQLVVLSRNNVGWQRNLGAKKARGDYLVFFDADIALPANFLETVGEAISETGAVFLTTKLAPDSARKRDRLYVWLLNWAVKICAKLKFKRLSLLPGHNIIIRQDIFWRLGGFDPTLAYLEDYLLAQQAKQQKVPLYFLPAPQQIVSLRRVRKEGYREFGCKLIKLAIYVLLRGEVKEGLVDYQMGGQYY